MQVRLAGDEATGKRVVTAILMPGNEHGRNFNIHAAGSPLDMGGRLHNELDADGIGKTAPKFVVGVGRILPSVSVPADHRPDQQA